MKLLTILELVQNRITIILIFISLLKFQDSFSTFPDIFNIFYFINFCIQFFSGNENGNKPLQLFGAIHVTIS